MDENNACYPVGAMPFEDVQLEIGCCWYDDDRDSQWLVELACWGNDADPKNPPETNWSMPPKQARDLAS